VVEKTAVHPDSAFHRLTHPIGCEQKPGERVQRAGHEPQADFGRGCEAFMKESEVESIIQSAMSGDLTAFNCLVSTFQDSLYGWVFSLVKDEALADDITQLTFITAYQKLSLFRGGSFRSWLFKIARNRSFDEMRRAKRHPTIPLEGSSEEAEDRDMLSFLPNTAPLPEDVFIAAENAFLIERVLEQMPDAYQQVLRLVDMEDMDYQEAAEVLNLPLGTVKSRLARARLKLRENILQSSLWLQAVE
jgi:RNA polymerase sigma-70 factor (ECF subfamily)